MSEPKSSYYETRLPGVLDGLEPACQRRQATVDTIIHAESLTSAGPGE